MILFPGKLCRYLEILGEINYHARIYETRPPETDRGKLIYMNRHARIYETPTGDGRDLPSLPGVWYNTADSSAEVVTGKLNLDSTYYVYILYEVHTYEVRSTEYITMYVRSNSIYSHVLDTPKGGVG